MFCLVMLLLVNTLAAQEIVTAPNYFTQVAQTYETVEDYLAEISISRGEGERMTGQLYYRHPNLLRIDFTQPEEQVLVTDGESLTLYIPAMNVTMKQSLADRQQGDDITAMASREGLGLLRRMYNVSYLTSPTPVPLEEGSSEMVVKLRLTWRNPSEGFREIIVSIGSDMLIRRMVGTTVNYDEVVLDFSNIQINQNIPVEQFDYRSPPSANQFHGFLFGSGN
ncbi:MAG: outer membrane lipoprotein carrier protein LolA [Spirochaetaceae bacterium]|nr:MAG: outer membrane lipoprotein carrier protein LolA [Spirochaetaceae bacterium]